MNGTLHDEINLPSSMDWIDGLVARYRATRGRMEQMAELMGREDMQAAVGFFLEASSRDRRYSAPAVNELFRLDPGIAALNSHYWGQAINQTDVLEIMPQHRRSEWHEMIRDHKCPEFDEQVVRDTLGDLLASRWKFFAEKVDGIFRALSGDHVTNSPSGFWKRMILANVFDQLGTLQWSKTGIVADLRNVIAKLEGREEPGNTTSEAILRYARANTGEWVECDGGRLLVKAFLVGTCHIEIHPDAATMLNVVLASLYPTAIPAKFRTRNAKPAKNWPLMQRPLPVPVLNALAGVIPVDEPTGQYGRGREYRRLPNCVMFRYGFGSDQARAEAFRVLEAIGGVREKGYMRFDYDPFPVIAQIAAAGTIPDKQSHQFFPTPRALAEKAVELAEIGPEHTCLEPSAGTGGLADLMPKERTFCSEISKLHAAVLQAKGYEVWCGDFLEWDGNAAFDRIVMNPPFSEGRWQAHLQHASRKMIDCGRLVAILPSGARNADPLPGWSCEWHGPFDNQFPDASVSVVILVAERKN